MIIKQDNDKMTKMAVKVYVCECIWSGSKSSGLWQRSQFKPRLLNSLLVSQKLTEASLLGVWTIDRDGTFSLYTTPRPLLHQISSSRMFASFRIVFFFPLSLSHRIRSISWRDALTWRPTVKFYLRFSSRLRWNLFEATRRVSKRRGEAVCRCCAVRRTSNENWWHNYQLGCVCAVVACCVVSSHHSIRPLHVRCLCAN